MSFAFFISFENRPGEARCLPGTAPASIRRVLSSVGGLSRAFIFTPASASDQFADDGVPPPLALQLYFEDLQILEAAVTADGPLRALVGTGLLGEVGEAMVTQQAFYVRSYPVDDPVIRPEASALPCSYVVHYPGPAADLNHWLGHYVTNHPPIMREFPDIRGIEILSRVDWCGGLPWPRADHMQRNRVLFDSPQALTRALHSPVRIKMSEDFATFPPFEGGNFHFPMATEEVLPSVSTRG